MASLYIDAAGEQQAPRGRRRAGHKAKPQASRQRSPLLPSRWTARKNGSERRPEC